MIAELAICLRIHLQSTINICDRRSLFPKTLAPNIALNFDTIPPQAVILNDVRCLSADVGASPSGKAAGFGLAIPRFES